MRMMADVAKPTVSKANGRRTKRRLVTVAAVAAVLLVIGYVADQADKEDEAKHKFDSGAAVTILQSCAMTGCIQPTPLGHRYGLDLKTASFYKDGNCSANEYKIMMRADTLEKGRLDFEYCFNKDTGYTFTANSNAEVLTDVVH